MDGQGLRGALDPDERDELRSAVDAHRDTIETYWTAYLLDRGWLSIVGIGRPA